MNPSLEPQPAQPERKIPFGLVSLIFALLTIVPCLASLDTYNPIIDWIPILLVLSAIAIIIGGVELYLISRKIPIGAILALITVLTFFAILALDLLLPDLFYVIPLLLLIWGFLYSIIQIILVIKNRVAILAHLGIALSLLCNIFVFVVSIIGAMGSQ